MPKLASGPHLRGIDAPRPAQIGQDQARSGESDRVWEASFRQIILIKSERLLQVAPHSRPDPVISDQSPVSAHCLDS